MMDKNAAMERSSALLREVESYFNRILERIQLLHQDRETVRNLFQELNQELESERTALSEFETAIRVFKQEKDNLQTQLKEYLDRAGRFLKGIETMVGQTRTELQKAEELSSRLEELCAEVREKSGRKMEAYSKTEDKPQSEDKPETTKGEAELEQEIQKLRKIKELLSSEPLRRPLSTGVKEGEAAGLDSGDREWIPPIPRLDEVIEKSHPGGDSRERLGFEKGPDLGGNFQVLFETLDKYRKSDTSNESGELHYFQNNEKLILDGEAIVSAISGVVEEVRHLYEQLGTVDSAKEQFFLKQNILNCQELLREKIQRSLKMCERVGCSLPSHTADLLNVAILKDTLEKLSMANWSAPAEFADFDRFAAALKDAFCGRITPPTPYLKSILEELEG